MGSDTAVSSVSAITIMTLGQFIQLVSTISPQRDIMAWTHGGYLFIVVDFILLRKGKEGMSWHGCSRALCVDTERPRGDCCGLALTSRPFSVVALAWRGRSLSFYSPSRLGSTPSLQ